MPHSLVTWDAGGKSDGKVCVSTFKQIGSLFAGSTIDGNRMICLTKYVTVRVSKGEPNLYDGFWLARVSAVPLPFLYFSLWLRVSYVHHTRSPRPCTHRRTDAFQMLHQLQN